MSDTFTKPEWNTETRQYSCEMNGLGSWWPMMKVKTLSGGWCPVIIRSSNPFKTLKGAIKFTEKTIDRINARNAKGDI